MKPWPQFLLFSGTFLLAGRVFAAPAAILTRVSGNVEVRRGASVLAGKNGLQLQNGDQIRVKNGAATVFSLSGPPKTLQGGSFTVGTAKTQSTAPLWKDVYAGLSRGLGEGRVRGAATMRPGQIRPVFPFSSLIETPRPRFEWQDSTPEPRYQVTVSDEAGKAVWRGQSEENAAANALDYPANAPALSGKLRWQVAPLRLDNGLWKPIEDRVSAPVEFGIASIAQLGAVKADLLALDGQISLADRALTRAALWNARGFQSAALRELEKAGSEATASALRRAIYQQIGQEWRLAAPILEAKAPIGGADPNILAISPNAPLEISQRKTYVAPDGSFSLQIPSGFGAQSLALPRGLTITEFATSLQNGARLSLSQAPGREFPQNGALFDTLSALIAQNNALPANAGDQLELSPRRAARFRGHDALEWTWKARTKGVVSSGQGLEWREGQGNAERVYLLVWGGQNARHESALRPLLDTLQVGSQVKTSAAAPDSAEALLTLFMEQAGASIETMKSLNEQQASGINAPQTNVQTSEIEFQKLDAARQQSAENTYPRAQNARLAAQMASRLAWDAIAAGQTEAATKWFARRAALDAESYRAQNAALLAQQRENDAAIARWSMVTPPTTIGPTYTTFMDGLFVLQSMFLQRRQTLSRDQNDWNTVETLSRQLLQMHQNRREMVFLNPNDDVKSWEEQAFVASALEDLGDAAQFKVDLDGARAYFGRALVWRRAIPENYVRRDVAQALRNRASMEAQIGENRLARDFFEQSLAELDRTQAVFEADVAADKDEYLREIRRTERAQSRSVALSNLGIVLANLGDYAGAEKSYKNAISVLDAVPTTGFSGGVAASARASALGNLAVLRSDSGDLEGGEELLRQTAEIHRSIGNDAGLALTLLNSSGLDDERGHPELALTKLSQARALFVQLQKSEQILSADIFAAKLERRSGDLGRARAMAESALGLARSIGIPDWIASASRSLANIRLDEAKTPLQGALKTEILALIEEAERADARSGSALSAISTLGLRARWQQDSGDLEGALQTLGAAIARFERVRATTSSSDQFSDLKSSYSLYDGAVHLLLQLNRPQEAFEMLGRARSKKLGDALRLSALKSKDPALQALLDRAAKLDEKLNKTRAALASEVAAPTTQRDETRVKTLTSLIAATQAEFFQISAQIKARNPRFEKALSLSPRELKRAQTAIPAGALLLQYALLDDGLYIFAVTPNSLKIYQPKAQKAELNAAVRAYRAAIDADIARLGRGEPVSSIDDPNSPLRRASAQLSSWLLEPVQSEIDAAKTVAIIPSGELFYLPFHALGEADKENKWRFLIEEKPVAYLAEGDLLSVAHQRDLETQGEGVLALGDPTGADLPEAKVEVESIARLFPGSHALTGAFASKTTLLLPASLQSRVLHLAAHGVLDGARPDQSFIQLSPSAGADGKIDDGKLRVGEIYGLDLNKVDLVTLSACRTALGEGEPDGTEISSLAQSFSSAGTPSVVASLWNVEDKSTSRLMETFYGALADGLPKGLALQKAQIVLLNDPKTRHPVFWAPFELLGDWR